MASKPTPKSTVALTPLAPATVDNSLDDYEEGEEEEPPKSVIKVHILAALNVWASESGEAKSKIGFDIQFPEEPSSVEPLEMETFLPDPPKEELIPLGFLPSPPPPSSSLDLGNPDEKPVQRLLLKAPANFSQCNLVKEYRRQLSYALCHRLLQEQMVVIMYWISPSGALKAPMATAKVDLIGLLNENALCLTVPLELYVEPISRIPLFSTKLDAKKTVSSSKTTPPPKKEVLLSTLPVPIEKKPVLLEGASLKLNLTSSKPLISEDDKKDGFIIEIGNITMRKLPQKVQDYGTARTSNPFSYTCGFTFPGLSGMWWNSINDFPETEKANISIFKTTTSAIDQEELTVQAPLVILDDLSMKANELKKIAVGDCDIKPSCDVVKQGLHEWKYPPTIKEMHNILVWKETRFRRFLPSQGANQLRDDIKKKNHLQGVVARYVKEESFNEFSDPYFYRYCGTFSLDLMPFLDEEGATSIVLSCPIKDFVEASGKIICPPDARPSSKTAKPVEDDSGPLQYSPSAVKDVPPSLVLLPLSNAWTEAGSVIYVTIKTSQPIEPIWKPPPEPELKVENIIPCRPKAPNLYNSVKVAIEKFKEFVHIAAHDILALHEKVLQGEHVGQPLGVDVLSTTKSRIESKTDVRKKVVQELHQSGAWQQMRDEMKSRVHRIAAEKFRLGQKSAITSGKFEFCNVLYVKLMEEIHICLAEMFLKRQRATKSLDGNVNEFSEKEKKLLLLRQLADEYEYDYDYQTANKFHQDRLLGETIHNPNVWFEYGCFCMRSKERGQQRDCGKAEECFREALTLDKKHIFSLLALACLMWHRGYFTQSEVLLYTAIDLHFEEEYIPWCILSQVYHGQGQGDNEKNCIKKAILLYTSSHEHHNTYTAPNILLSPLLKFPFNVSYLFLQENLTHSTIFVETSLLLLDLHLQKEGKQILDLECDVFSTAVDNKWAQAKVHELNKEYNKAEIWLKENLSITEEEPMSWLCLGHSRYVNKDFVGALKAYKKHLRYQGTKEVYPYVYLDIGNSYLQLRNFLEAKKTFLKLCQICPTTSSWLGAGIAFFRTCEYKYAEISLVEANHINNKNQKVWAYLTLVCLALDRTEEAEISFQQLQKVKLIDVPLLLEVADSFAKIGNYRDAEAAVKDALKDHDGKILARFKFGELYHQQGKLECAKLEYENIMRLEEATCSEKSLAEQKLSELQAETLSASQPTYDHRVTI